jgi:hypothetical protein
MADVTGSSTATPASAAPASPSPTLGQSIDAEITIVKPRIAALELAGKSDWAAFKARVAKDWPHFVTWIGLASSSAPVIEFVKKLI